MAITIQQDPTTPNVANSNLVYVVTSNLSSNAQFQYVLDIRDNSDTLIQRVKQQPNPSAKGVFDIGNIIPTQLGTDAVWNTDAAVTQSNVGQDFKITFGEEYGSSPSSSLTQSYNETSGSEYYFYFDGFQNESALKNFNWNSASKYDEEDTDGGTFTHQNGLTDFPATQSIRLEDYHTISFLNGNLLGEFSGSLDSGSAQDVYAVIMRQYDSTGTEISESVIYNNGNGGPRGNSIQPWSTVYQNQDESTRLIHFPAGPENWSDAGFPIDTDTSYYELTFNNQALSPTGVNEDGIWGQYRFVITDKNCGYNGVRFAWKNRYGVWDYYTFGLAESTTSTIERKQYKQSFVDFSTTTNSVNYNRERRGKTNYYNEVTKLRTAQTDYLNQTDADNIRELFFSTDVFVQQANGEWWPVIIETATVTEKVNPRTQKLYTYRVEYQFANGQRPRL